MEYRIALDSDTPKLKELFAKFNADIPQGAMIAIAVDDKGNIEGFLVSQLQLHMEPIFIANPHVNYTNLVYLLEGELSNNINKGQSLTYYAFSPNDHVTQLAKYVGMVETGYSVMAKTIEGQGG